MWLNALKLTALCCCGGESLRSAYDVNTELYKENNVRWRRRRVEYKSAFTLFFKGRLVSVTGTENAKQEEKGEKVHQI